MGTSGLRSEDSQRSGSSRKPTTDGAGKSPLGQARLIWSRAADASVFSFGDEDFDSE
jgi:phosphatidylinositol-3,4,5-trisphosphate 3-phosphatase/dual-specificity protein phosphatase PTEN